MNEEKSEIMRVENTKSIKRNTTDIKNTYPTLIEEKDGDYLVYVPDMDIYTEGKNLTDAIEMARDAIGLKGVTMEDDGAVIPVPSSKEQAIAKAKSDADDIFDYSNGLLTYVDVNFTEYRRRYDNRMVRRNVTLPCWLDHAAEKAHINVSKVLQEAVKETLAISR